MRRRTTTTLRAAIGAAALAVAASALAPAASAAGGQTAAPAATADLRPGGLTYLRAKSTPATGYVAARPADLGRVSSVKATFVVTYTGFSAPAKAAFQRAVDLWSTLIKADVPIRIDATWKAMGPGILGGAGAVDYGANFPGAPQADTWYPVALANQLAGQDLSPSDPDIQAIFQSSPSQPWYFGTDGQVPAGQMDFTTVVLHEIGHGLGFSSSFQVASGSGSWGLGSGRPFRFDRFVQNGSGTNLITYASPSTALATQLQSNAVRWSGAQAVAANGGVKPYLYSPNPYQSGSSLSHLDETRYPTGGVNSLMTPYLDDGEALHDPGDIGLGVLRDLGWKTVGAKGVAAAPTLLSTSTANGRVTLTWKAPIDTGRQLLTGFRIYRYPVGSDTSNGSIDISSPNATSGAYTGLTNGTAYRYAVAARNASGFSAPSAKTGAIASMDSRPFTTTDRLIAQQFSDFCGRAPTAAEKTTWQGKANAGQNAGQLVDGIANLTGCGDRSGGMTRLYSAYFRRLPDYSGYTYWIGKLRSGTKLSAVSDQFAASSEFKNTYGSLSNTGFVNLVYGNVLQRKADAAGVAHWVKKLETGMTRGGMMTQFSESSEGKRVMAPYVDVLLLRLGLLRALPTTGVFGAETLAVANDISPISQIADDLRLTPAYASRTAS